MIQTIPNGVTKIATARSLQNSYLSVIEEIKNNPESVIGITNREEINVVLINTARYERLLELAESIEAERINQLEKIALKEYSKGEYEVVNEKWIAKMRK